MKGLYKWVGVFVAIFFYVLMLRGTEAEAATTTDGKTYYDLRTEVDWTGYETQRDIALSFDYVLIQKQSNIWFIYRLCDSNAFSYDAENDYLGIFQKYTVYVNISDRKIFQVNDRRNSNGTVVHPSDMDGSTYFYIGSNFDFTGTKYASYPSQNIDFWEDTSITVDITVNGIDYSVSEDYPYYLALKNPQGNIRLFFSDTPFTASFVDLYTMQFEIAPDANVVKYYWDSGEQNDFLSSRSVSVGFDAFRFKCTGDHMSNYSIPDTNNPLYYVLYEKAAFTLPTETLTAKDLYAALPDELSKYYHIIIFRQDSPNAYDNRILFYGWNDNNANLYIHSSNSQIAALNKKGAVSDYATAYYDESLNAWVLSDDVVLGATTDASYNVPYIFHSDLDLFVCDEWNVWNGLIAYPGDDNRPLVSFDEPEQDEDESLLESILSGIKKLFVSLFVPSDGFFSARVNEITSNFGFWTSVRDTTAVFIDFLKETDFSEPPKVQIDLASVKSKVSYGGKVYILDFSFYEPYKESVDVILSAIMWLVFAWNTYKNLPNIIGGIGGGMQASASLLDDGKED